MFAIMEPSAVTGTYRTIGPTAKAGACDQCRHRKVRCDMGKPCSTCRERGFSCTYDKIRKKRGPAGKRVTEIRRNQAGGPTGTTTTTSVPPDIIQQHQQHSSHPPPLDHASSHSDQTTPSGEQTPSPATSSFTHHYVPHRQDVYPLPPDPAGQYVSQSPLAPMLPGGGYMPSPWDQAVEAAAVTGGGGGGGPGGPGDGVWSPATSAIDPLLANAPGGFKIPSFPVESESPSEAAAAQAFAALPEQFVTATEAEAEAEAGAGAEADVWPRLINEASLLPWIDVWFKRLHPTLPILDRVSLYHDMLLRQHRADRQYGAMLLALCAFAMTQPVRMEERASLPSRAVQARMLLEEAARMRCAADFGEHPTLPAVLTSFFLFACLFGANQHRAAWHRLREAVDLAFSLGLHDPRAYRDLTAEQREQWLRTYLVLSVTERAYALQRQHSIGFRGRPSANARFMQNFDLSRPQEEEEAGRIMSGLLAHDRADAIPVTGLLYLMESFDAIDEGIVGCWNGHCAPADGLNGGGNEAGAAGEQGGGIGTEGPPSRRRGCSRFDGAPALLRVFAALRAARRASYAGASAFAPGTRSIPLAALAESQRADIALTQTWLVNRVWSLGRSHGLIQNGGGGGSDGGGAADGGLVTCSLDARRHPELRTAFAFHIGLAAVLQARSLERRALEVHGVGLIEKLYDIAHGVLTALREESSTPNPPTSLNTLLHAPLSTELLDDLALLDPSLLSLPSRAAPRAPLPHTVRAVLDALAALILELRSGETVFARRFVGEMEGLLGSAGLGLGEGVGAGAAAGAGAPSTGGWRGFGVG